MKCTCNASHDKTIPGGHHAKACPMYPVIWIKSVDGLDTVIQRIGSWAKRTYPTPEIGAMIDHLEEEFIELKSELEEIGGGLAYKAVWHPDEDMSHVAEEVSDMIMILFSLSSRLELDLVNALDKKFRVMQRSDFKDPDVYGVIHRVDPEDQEDSEDPDEDRKEKEAVNWESNTGHDSYDEEVSVSFLSREERLAMCPNTQRDYEILLDEIASIRARKVQQYGEARYNDPVELSMWSVFVDIRRKFQRIKSGLLEGKAQIDGGDSLRDAFLDMANYALMGVQIMDKYSGGAVDLSKVTIGQIAGEL